MKFMKQTILFILLTLGLPGFGYGQTSNSTPPLNNPGAWLKSLQDIKDLKPFTDVQRCIALMEYADAAKDNAFYFQARTDFFKALKRDIPNGLTRIEFILAVWPGMVRRNHFDGLKAAMTDIDVMMDKNKVGNYAWAYYNAILAGFALALNDKESANMYLKAGGTYTRHLIDVPNAVAWKPINGDKVFDTLPGRSIDMNDSTYYYFCKIAIHLAQKGDTTNYTKFIANAKKRGNYRDSIAYTFAIADATLGEFDRARLHWKQYNAQSRNPWDSQFCLSFIIRQEFLAGEFRSWDTKDQMLTQLSKEKDALAEDMGGSALPQFYFDYGRGIARHKTNQEITEEYNDLSSKLAKDELAFFMAGVATGLQDKKNPKR